MSSTDTCRGLQLGYAALHPEEMYSRDSRHQKARKVLAILRDCLGDRLAECRVADVGCSTGIITGFLAAHVADVLGIDIDEQAVNHARQHESAAGARYEVYDGRRLPLDDASVDLVICAHVYEHAPSAQALMDEIHRVLKPQGYCFFAAGNRLILIEQHYKLPLLSVIPPRWADYYLRLTGKGDSYYERHLTYWSLKKLVRRFRRIDYTKRVIDAPERFHATEMIRPNSLKQMAARLVARCAMGLCPGYLWMLQKV